jgi:hypothetical protein
VPAPYTDLLNEAIDDLTATLTAVTSLRVVNDPTKLVPNCVFMQRQQSLRNIVRVDFPIKVVGSGPAGLPVLREILQITATVLGSSVIVMSGRPGTLDIGGQEYPCYDLAVGMQAHRRREHTHGHGCDMVKLLQTLKE